MRTRSQICGIVVEQSSHLNQKQLTARTDEMIWRGRERDLSLIAERETGREKSVV